MSKCANCTSDSSFVYRLTATASIEYCDAHLPRFLLARKQADLIQTTDAFSKDLEKALAVVSPEKEDLTEEPPSDEGAPDPKPAAPKKKTSTKSEK